jgi:hypothetical protein
LLLNFSKDLGTVTEWLVAVYSQEYALTVKCIRQDQRPGDSQKQRVGAAP